MVENFEDLVQKNKVKEGQTFANYSRLCEWIGIPVTQGKQRQYDQRRLQCYFSWEKAERGNSLTITETYYDTPRPLEDGRIGIHTTVLGGMLQDMFLTTPWKEDYYSISKFLYEMGLFSQAQSKYVTRLHKAEHFYCSRLCGRLKSAINQINKKDPFTVPLFVVNLETGEPVDEEEWETFRRIKAETLAEFDAQSEGALYWRKQYKSYLESLSKKTYHEMGMWKVNERYWTKGWIARWDIRRPTNAEFLTLFGQDILDGYPSGGIGVASKETMKKDLEEIFRRLNEDVTLTL